MPKLEEVFNTNELINYFKDRQETPMLGEILFPERKIQDIVLNFFSWHKMLC